jgi:hypothetical protein
MRLLSSKGSLDAGGDFSHLTLVTAFYTRGQMALSSHDLPLARTCPTDSTRLSSEETLDVGGDFQGTVEEGGGSQEFTHPNRFDAVAGLSASARGWMNSGGNIDQAPGSTDLTRCGGWSLMGELKLAEIIQGTIFTRRLGEQD